MATKAVGNWTNAEYRKIRAFLTLALFKHDGSYTKFARKYGVRTYSDFYKVFKTIKENLKKDREGIAFEIIIDMAKSVVGRLKPRMQSTLGIDATFAAFVYVLRTIAFILDDLKTLKVALKKMDDENKSRKK